MVHGFNYPDETGRENLEVRLWNPIMRSGVIEFINPEMCTLIRKIRSFEVKEFSLIKSVDEFYTELGGD